MTRRLLILGGTAEAAALARLAVERFAGRLEVTTSLAGRTAAPHLPPGRVRIGGFGGAAGLEAHLRESRTDLLVDATHPFAARIAEAARRACAAAGVPRLVLERPPWRAGPGDDWREAADMADAAALLPALGRRPFLTVGSGELGAFSRLSGIRFLVRLVDPPGEPLPLPDHEVVTGRGPFRREDEEALLRRHGIDLLVTKASGGAATSAKLDAARALGLPVLMVRRPPAAPGPRVHGAEDAAEWIGRMLVCLDPRPTAGP